MADLLDDMRKVVKLNGDTYSSAEVIGMVSRAADEIEGLQAQIEDACKVFEHYDLPEHALHYRRVALGMSASAALAHDETRRDMREAADEIKRLRTALKDAQPFLEAYVPSDTEFGRAAARWRDRALVVAVNIHQENAGGEK